MVGQARQNAQHPAVAHVSLSLLSLLADGGMKGNFVMKPCLNSFDARQTLAVGAKIYAYYSLYAAEGSGLSNASRLPCPLKSSSRTCCATKTAAAPARPTSRMRRSGSTTRERPRRKSPSGRLFNKSGLQTDLDRLGFNWSVSAAPPVSGIPVRSRKLSPTPSRATTSSRILRFVLRQLAA